MEDKSRSGNQKNKALSIKGRFVYYIYRLVWSSLDLIYPPICGGCERSGKRWCQECCGAVNILREPTCPICGDTELEGNICLRCSTDRPIFQQLRSWGQFNGPLRNAIHKLKYQRDITLGEILSRPLIDMVINQHWSLDLVIPVPLSRDRIKSRGYNQAALIALPLALGLEIKYHPKALVRVRSTDSQVGLSYQQRYDNVCDAFLAYNSIVRKKQILIVDDVVTSGATINACAKALVQSGAEAVYAATLARAMYN